MRSAEQISRTVGEWHDLQRAEREEHLRAFLQDCREARERGEEWIRWIDEGCPRLTVEEYEQRTGGRAPGGRGRRQRTLADSDPGTRTSTPPARRRSSAESPAGQSQLC